MKINIEMDCTPEEFRQCFGLPDLRPIQEAVLGAMAGGPEASGGDS